jgi:GNAT superfamily N-acetyltransferase
MDELRSYNPSLRDRIAWGIAGGLGKFGADKHRQRWAANKIGGLIDFVPGVGDAVGIDDAYRDYQAGNYGLAAAGLGATAVGAVPGVGDALKAVMDKAAAKGVELYLSNPRGRIVVDKIVVPKELRGKGLGTDIMNEVISASDALGMPLSLTPSGDFGGNVNRLHDFYKSFGFESNVGRKRDYEINESMRRYPNSK